MVNHLSCLFVVAITVFCGYSAHAQYPGDHGAKPVIVSRIVSSDRPHWHGAMYVTSGGLTLRSGNYISPDNGKSWTEDPITPDMMKSLPYGFRRNPVTSVLDTIHHRIINIVNAMDTRDLDPKISEPKIAQQTYYLRYRTSADAGKSWTADLPIIEEGDYTEKNPLPGVFVGANSFYLGDIGSKPIVTALGTVLIPAQVTILKEGVLWNPGGLPTFTDVVVIRGIANEKGELTWKTSDRISLDKSRSTRGVIEPTLAAFSDGRILAIMRGSNGGKQDPEYQMPAHKWFAVSEDDGIHWTAPEPWTFDDGAAFYSASSMSSLFKHSSGRYFWLGNLSEENAKANAPRWPLIMAEVDPVSLRLIRSTLLTIDTQYEDDLSKGRLDISHFDVIEDRQTREILITYPKNYHSYQERDWITVRIAVRE